MQLHWKYCCVFVELKEEESKDALTDGDPDTYWETDGSQGRHWIKLLMRPGTVIRLVNVRIKLKP